MSLSFSGGTLIQIQSFNHHHGFSLQQPRQFVPIQIGLTVCMSVYIRLPICLPIGQLVSWWSEDHLPLWLSLFLSFFYFRSSPSLPSCLFSCLPLTLYSTVALVSSCLCGCGFVHTSSFGCLFLYSCLSTHLRVLWCCLYVLQPVCVSHLFACRRGEKDMLT